MTLLRPLASLRLTLVGLVLLGGGLVIDQNHWLPSAWVITPPLLLLGINLAAALVVDPRFRRQPALFAFHLCLLLLALLASKIESSCFSRITVGWRVPTTSWCRSR